MKNNFLKIYGIISFLAVGFINAFVDLGHKIIIQNTIYKVYDGSMQLFLTAIVNALILLPFIMTLSLSGFLADKYPKNKVMRISAWFSVLFTIIICFCYYIGAFWAAFVMTFIMGIQSAIYSPAKYGYIKELVGKELLAMGNGAINAVSIVAILAGMAVFSLTFEMLFNPSFTTTSSVIVGVAPLGFLLVIFSIIELVLAYRLPKLTDTDNSMVFDKKSYLSGKMLSSNIGLIFQNKTIWLCIVGISLFWAISQLYLVSFPVYAKNELFELNTFYVQLVMAASGIGIVIGSIVAGRMSKNYIELGFIPLGALGILIIALLVPYFGSLFAYGILFLIFGISGAFFIVPLNALIQFNAKEKELGKVLAGNNFIQNIFMFLFLAFATLVAYLDINVVYVFYFITLVSLFGALYVVLKLPFSLVRILLSLAFTQRYRLLVEGFDNIPEKGGALLLGNHVSFIDWAIVQMAIPRKVHFVMERSYYSKWYLRIFLDRFGVIPVSSGASREALELIAQRVKNGDLVCLFPEGALSRHGHLNEFKSGFELVGEKLEDSESFIIPFYMHGLWGSSFSRSDEEFAAKNKTLGKRLIAIAFGKPMSIHSKKDEVKAKVFELSFVAWKSQCDFMKTLGKAFIDSAKKNLNATAIVDQLAGDVSFRKLLGLSITLSSFMQKNSSTKEPLDTVGIMLPASMASSLCNLSALLCGKVVVNLNFTAGANAIKAAINSAKIKQIYTSKKFLQTLEDKGVVFDFDGAKIFYMEDITNTFKAKKLQILLTFIMVSVLPSFILKALFTKNNNSNDVAAILFSSGSEGTPKGVMLNHKNILSNIAQISEVLCAKDDDCVLSSLPPFHAFGLTVTTFMPLIQGLKSVTFADPTNAIGVAKVIAKNNVTIMCGTSTFLGIYARNKKLDEIMFESVRIVVAGAEKLKSEVRTAFEMKFKKTIYEGYGATETTPVASVNLPNKFDSDYWIVHRASKIGSVGMPLPGTAVRIVDPNTYETLKTGEDGLILIGGHQIMVGYLNNEEKTNEVIKEIDGIRWYNTGDKGHLDEDGFLYIVDRYSRFAKIGGEMVSLGMVEEEIGKVVSEESKFSVVAVEDSKKGEMVVALIQSDDFEGCVEAIKNSNMPALFKPSKYFSVEQIPLLGSGKVDFKGSKALALELLEKEAN